MQLAELMGHLWDTTEQQPIQRVNAKHPLNGYRLKNTSALHLMQGPITLFDNGTSAGDTRIEDLPPGEDRLISYALDLKTEVEPKLEGGT